VSGSDAVVYALLALGVGAELIACLGVVVMRDLYDRLHFLGPSALGAVLIVAAIWVREGPSMISLKATLIGAFLLFATPVLVHVTARAGRINELGDWRRQPAERIEIEEP
jgi:monovalent cation/proton antiporter MnhG/PhaG subunit